jgi:UDP-N-acetylmuramate--alanine ligase
MKKYHFIGIGGIGMSALSRLALAKGDIVQGSDKIFSQQTRLLEKEGATVFLGHSAENVHEGYEIVYSSDIKQDNPEWKKARALGLKMLHRSELLAEMSSTYKQVFVAGTHGKTTTTSLLSTVLLHAGKDPSYVIGGMLVKTGSNAQGGNGEFFVLEADESDGSFLKGSPYAAIVTNLEKEHLDYWKSLDNLILGFRQFFQKIERKELAFWCIDDPLLLAISPNGTSYGFSPQADLQVRSFRQEGFYVVFDAFYRGITYKEIKLHLIGKHNCLNAAAVFGLSLDLGISEQKIREAFQTFEGVGRRMEFIGAKNGIDYFDDYAHHPTEIAVTLAGLKRAVSTRRLVAVFQPHRFSRVKDLGDEFPASFSQADLVLMTDIYSAGESPIEGAPAKVLFEKIKKLTPAHFLSKEDLEKSLQGFLKTGDVVVTLGAGDITHLARKLVAL